MSKEEIENEKLDKILEIVNNILNFTLKERKKKKNRTRIENTNIKPNA